MGSNTVTTTTPKLERVAGIEPASSAWKAEVLPLNYTRLDYIPETGAAQWRGDQLNPQSIWWWGKDSNLRRQCRQIYSLIPLTAREPLHGVLLIKNANRRCLLAFFETGGRMAIEPTKKSLLKQRL